MKIKLDLHVRNYIKTRLLHMASIAGEDGKKDVAKELERLANKFSPNSEVSNIKAEALKLIANFTEEAEKALLAKIPEIDTLEVTDEKKSELKKAYNQYLTETQTVKSVLNEVVNARLNSSNSEVC